MKYLSQYRIILLGLFLCLVLFGRVIGVQAAELMAPSTPSQYQQQQQTTPGSGYAKQATQAKQVTSYTQPKQNIYSGPALQTQTPCVLKTSTLPEVPISTPPKLQPVTYVEPAPVKAINQPGVASVEIPLPPGEEVVASPTKAINLPGVPAATIPTSGTPKVTEIPEVSIIKPPQEPAVVTPPPSTLGVIKPPPSALSVIKPTDTAATDAEPEKPKVATPEKFGIVDVGEGKTVSVEGEDAAAAGETKKPLDVVPGAGTYPESATTSTSHEDDGAMEVRKQQENIMLQQMAHAVRTDAKQEAMALLHIQPNMEMVTRDATEQRGVFEAAIAEQRKRTTRLGALLKEKQATDTTLVATVATPEMEVFNMLWAAMLIQVEEEVQNEKDKHDREAKKRIRRIRERIRKMLERNRKERERRRKNRARRRNMERQRDLGNRRDKLAEKRWGLDRRAEQFDNKEKEYEWRDKELREEEQRARRNDPSGRGEEVRRIRAEREALQRKRVQTMKDKMAWQKEFDSYQRDWREYEADKRAFDKSLDSGEGMTKKEWKHHMLKKEERKLNDQRNALERQRISLEWKDNKTKTEKQRLEKIKREIGQLDRGIGKYKTKIGEIETELKETQGGTWGELARQTDEQLKMQGARLEKTIEGLKEIEARIGKGGDQPANSNKFGKQMQDIHDNAGKLNKNYQKAIDRYEKAEMEHKENLRGHKGLEHEQNRLKARLETVRERLSSGKGSRDDLRWEAEIMEDLKEVQKKIDINNQHMARERSAFQIANNEYEREFNKLKEQADAIQDDLMLEELNNWTNDYNRSYGDTINEDGSVNMENLEKQVKQLEEFTDLASDMTKGIQELGSRKAGLTQSVGDQPSLAERLKLSPEQLKTAQDSLDEKITEITNAQDKLISDMSKAGYELESRISEKGEFSKYVIVESSNPLIPAYSQAVDKVSRELASVNKEKPVKGQAKVTKDLSSDKEADSTQIAEEPLEAVSSAPEIGEAEGMEEPTQIAESPETVPLAPEAVDSEGMAELIPPPSGPIGVTPEPSKPLPALGAPPAPNAGVEKRQVKPVEEVKADFSPRESEGRSLQEVHSKNGFKANLIERKKQQATEYKELAKIPQSRADKLHDKAKGLRDNARKWREASERYHSVARDTKDRELASDAEEAAANAAEEAAKLDTEADEMEREAAKEESMVMHYMNKGEEIQKEAEQLEAEVAKAEEAEMKVEPSAPIEPPPDASLPSTPKRQPAKVPNQPLAKAPAAAPAKEEPDITIPLRGAKIADAPPSGNVTVISSSKRWGEYEAWIREAMVSAYSNTPFVRDILIPQAMMMGELFGPELAEGILNDIMNRYMGSDSDPVDFLSDMLEKMVQYSVAGQGPEVEMKQKILFAGMLQRVMNDPRLQKQWGVSDNSRGYMQDRLDRVVNELKPLMSKQLKLANEAGDIMQELEVTAGYISLFSLSSQISSDLMPGLKQLNDILDRLGKQADLSLGESIEGAIKATKSLEGLALRTGNMDAKMCEQVFDTLAKSLEFFSRQVRKFAQQEKYCDTRIGKEWEKQADLANLQRARTLLCSGKFEEALSTADYVTTYDTDVIRKRSLTLLQIVSEIEQKMDTLSPELNEEFTPERLSDFAANARFNLLSIAKTPGEAAIVGVDLVRGIEQAGNLAWALQVLEEMVMPKAKDDPILQGLKLHLEIKQQKGLSSAETIGRLICGLPAELQGIALNGAIGFLGKDTTYEVLDTYEKVISGLETIDEQQKNGLGLKLNLAHLQLQTLELPSAARDDSIIEQIKIIRGKLNVIDQEVRTMVEQVLEGIEKGLEPFRAWRDILHSGRVPEGGYSNLARQAFTEGRLDIAGEAIARQMQYAYEHGDYETAPPQLTEAAILTQLAHQRLMDQTLTGPQKEAARDFFKKVKDATENYFDKFLTEMNQSYSKGWRSVAQKGITGGSRIEELDQKLQNLRVLYRMQAQIQIAGLSAREARQSLNEMLATARKKVINYEKLIEEKYAKAGTAVNSGETGAIVRGLLADLDAMRAARDGMCDLWLKRYGVEATGEYIAGKGSFLPGTTARFQELRKIEGDLNGVAPMGFMASPSARQSHYEASWKRGARNSLIYRRGTIANVTDPNGMPIKVLLAENKVEYLERRRMQLIFEDTSLTLEQRREMLLNLFRHEAKSWERLGKDVSPLLMPELTQIGKSDLERAKARYTYADNTALGFTKEDFETYRDSDPQRAFMALIKVREANLTHEIDLFVNHLDDSFWSRGPVKGIGVGLHSGDVAEALNSYSAEQMKLHPALIRAAYRPVEKLDEADRKILTKYDFIVDGKYAVPKDLSLEPVTAASDFVDRTTSIIDKYVNIRQGLELTATVVLPGGFSARMAGGTLARHSLAQILRKEGAEFTLKNAARYLATKDGAKWAAAWVGERFIEGALFTGLSRTAQTAIHPEMLMNPELWSVSELGSEYLHSVGVLCALRVVGVGNQMAKKRISDALNMAGRSNTVQALFELATYTAEIATEAETLTQLAKLGCSPITQEDEVGNFLTVIMLRATHIMLRATPLGDIQRSEGKIGLIHDSMQTYDLFLRRLARGQNEIKLDLHKATELSKTTKSSISSKPAKTTLPKQRKTKIVEAKESTQPGIAKRKDYRNKELLKSGIYDTEGEARIRQFLNNNKATRTLPGKQRPTEEPGAVPHGKLQLVTLFVKQLINNYSSEADLLGLKHLKDVDGIKTRFEKYEGELKKGDVAEYQPETNTIVISLKLKNVPTERIAETIAHELQHGYDQSLLGDKILPSSVESEQRALLVQHAMRKLIEIHLDGKGITLEAAIKIRGHDPTGVLKGTNEVAKVYLETLEAAAKFAKPGGEGLLAFIRKTYPGLDTIDTIGKTMKADLKKVDALIAKLMAGKELNAHDKIMLKNYLDEHADVVKLFPDNNLMALQAIYTKIDALGDVLKIEGRDGKAKKEIKEKNTQGVMIKLLQKEGSISIKSEPCFKDKEDFGVGHKEVKSVLRKPGRGEGRPAISKELAAKLGIPVEGWFAKEQPQPQLKDIPYKARLSPKKQQEEYLKALRKIRAKKVRDDALEKAKEILFNASYPDAYVIKTEGGERIEIAYEAKTPSKRDERVRLFFINQFNWDNHFLKQMGGRHKHLPEEAKNVLVIDLRNINQTPKEAMDDIKSLIIEEHPAFQRVNEIYKEIRFIWINRFTGELDFTVPIKIPKVGDPELYLD